MNPAGKACSEQRSHHCTPAWATEQDSVLKKKKERKKEKKHIKQKFAELKGEKDKAIIIVGDPHLSQQTDRKGNQNSVRSEWCN